jgi:hypothetical protein
MSTKKGKSRVTAARVTGDSEKKKARSYVDARLERQAVAKSSTSCSGAAHFQLNLVVVACNCKQ